MPQRNVNLTDHFDSFIAKTVQSGRFSNASEMVREGLRLLEQREREDEARIALLRSATQDGLHAMEDGDFVSLGSEEAIKAFVTQLRRDVATPRKKMARIA